MRDLEVGCHIGVSVDERRTEQSLFLDIELETAIAAAVSSEELTDTIDFNAIAAVIREVAGQREYRLVEALADEVAGQLLQAFPAVTHLGLEIRKRSPALGAGACFVRIERQG